MVCQVAGGPWDRPYWEEFLKYGVALIGPGDSGPGTEDRDKDQDFPPVVKDFAKGPRPGDVIVLRLGVQRIVAVGLIASGYEYLPQFDDVQGWDLQHARRVRWFRLPEPHDFPTRTLGGSRFSGVWNPAVIDFAMSIVRSSITSWQTALLPDLPKEEPELTELPTKVGPLVGEVHDLLGFYWGPDYRSSLPSEDEIIAHVVIPFLKALGWRSEHIAFKWQDMDLVLFDPPQRRVENVRFVIEAKRLGYGLEYALEQAKGYVEKLGTPRDIVVTDGVRYRLYSAENDYAQAAYANLGRLKTKAKTLFERLSFPPHAQGE